MGRGPGRWSEASYLQLVLHALNEVAHHGGEQACSVTSTCPRPLTSGAAVHTVWRVRRQSLSSLTGIPAVFVRKEAKSHGTCRLAEGADVEGRQVTLVEDVLTTGGAVRDAAAALRALGASVGVVLCAIDRSGQVGGPVTDIGLQTMAVLTKDDLNAARAGQEVR